MPKIKKIKAREILDSRGELTLEVEVETEDGVFKAQVPSGTSEGEYEAVEVAPEKAVANIEKIIAPCFKGEDVSNQQKIDELLIKLDSTEDKSKLGANATLGVSVACLRAGAAAKKFPLYHYISHCNAFQAIAENLLQLPRPCFNVLNGGVHAGSDLDFQEFMIIPETESFKESLRAGAEIYHHLKEILEKKFGKTAVNVGYEGGFTPPLTKTKEALDLIMEAIKKADYEEKIKIGLDCAASEFFKDGKYNFEGKKLTGKKLSEILLGLAKQYPILFLEDPFHQDDWQPWKDFQQFYNSSRSYGIIEKRFLVVGDDLTATNPKRIKEAKEKEACDGIILKPDQIGTVTEAVEAAKLAKEFEWEIIVSHRSGDTCDDFIADFAVGVGANFIKAGAPARGERVAKYNRLLRIEEEVIK